jgi:hypothetical protein
MVVKSLKNVVLFVLFICVINFSLFSQTSMVIKQIDEAITQKNSGLVSEILIKNKNSKSYKDYESHILKKARELLIANELDLAAEISLAVIDNNLDNFDAVALYTSIDAAIKERDAKLKAEEERRQIEEMRVMANNAKEQKQIKKEYQTISNTSSGETVYLDTDYNTHYLPISWAVNIGMADLALYIDTREVSGKFGLSSFGNLFYHADEMIIGGDYFVDTMLFNFGSDAEEEQHLDTTLKLAFAYSHESFIRNFYFRLGFLGYLSNSSELSYVPTPFFTPTLGIAYRDIEIGNILAELSADYFVGHLFYDKMKFAMDFSLNFSLILADLDKADIGINFGVRDALFSMEEGLQNQLKLIISIGVINND